MQPYDYSHAYSGSMAGSMYHNNAYTYDNNQGNYDYSQYYGYTPSYPSKQGQHGVNEGNDFNPTSNERTNALFLANLHPPFDEAFLSSFFQRFRGFIRLKLPQDRRTGKFKGHGFVNFQSIRDASAARDALNFQPIGNTGSYFQISFANPPSQEKPPVPLHPPYTPNMKNYGGHNPHAYPDNGFGPTGQSVYDMPPSVDYRQPLEHNKSTVYDPIGDIYNQSTHDVAYIPAHPPANMSRGRSPVPPLPSNMSRGRSPVPPLPSNMSRGRSPVPPAPSNMSRGRSPVPPHPSNMSRGRSPVRPPPSNMSRGRSPVRPPPSNMSRGRSPVRPPPSNMSRGRSPVRPPSNMSRGRSPSQRGPRDRRYHRNERSPLNYRSRSPEVIHRDQLQRGMDTVRNTSVGHGQSDTSVCYSMFVGNLPFTLSEDQLLEHIHRYLPRSSVCDVHIIRDHHHQNRNKGYAFVRFTQYDDLRRATRACDGTNLKGFAIRCAAAETKRTDTADSSTRRVDIVDKKIPENVAPPGASRVQVKLGALPPKYLPALQAIALTALAPAPSADEGNTTLFVARVDPKMTELELRYMFSGCGPISRVHISNAKSVGFVQFQYRKHAEYALATLDGQRIGDRTIGVEWSREPRHDEGTDRNRKRRRSRSPSLSTTRSQSAAKSAPMSSNTNTRSMEQDQVLDVPKSLNKREARIYRTMSSSPLYGTFSEHFNIELANRKAMNLLEYHVIHGGVGVSTIPTYSRDLDFGRHPSDDPAHGTPLRA